jgi:hypothetical protein
MTRQSLMSTETHSDMQLLYPPWPHVAPGPGHETLLSRTVSWALRQRVVEPASPSLYSLERMRSDLATVHAYPTATGERAQFISDFIGWYLLLDDALETIDPEERFLPRMSARFDRCFAAMTQPSELEEEEESEALVAGALDLGRRVRALSSPAWQARFHESLRTYYHQGVVHEIAHRARGTLPDFAAFTDFRVESSGSYPIFDLIELARGRELPLEVAAHPAIQELRRVAAIVISWANDVLSSHKERRTPLNHPVLLVRHKGMDAQQALDETVAVHNAEMLRFMTIKQNVLREAALDTSGVRGWLDDLVMVMRGLLEWQLRATRYTSGRHLSVRIVELDLNV